MSRQYTQLVLRRGKCPVRAVTRTGAISSDNTEMVRDASAQPADVGTNILVCVPTLGLRGSC